MNNLHTITNIVDARDMWRHRHKVDVAVRKLGLVPVKVEGCIRFYDDDQRAAIEKELDRIEAKKASATTRP